MSSADSGDDRRRARILRLLDAGRRITNPKDPLGSQARSALAMTSGLSREGVELALSDHVETTVSPADLDRLAARAGRAPQCHIILPANVCTAALRCIAVGLATSDVVFVRPSRRDPGLAPLLVAALTEDAAFAITGGVIRLVDELEPRLGDEVHLYGSDASMDRLRQHFGAGVVVRAHGTGIGVALVEADADVPDAAWAIARDVIPFDQRGCLSPRAVLVDGSADKVLALATYIHDALGNGCVPRGLLDATRRAEVARYNATMEGVGAILCGTDHVVGVDLEPRALPLPPAARVVHVARSSAASALPLLAPWAHYVTAIGATGDGPLCEAALTVAPWARRSPLGCMQRPPLDGPVDLRED